MAHKPMKTSPIIIDNPPTPDADRIMHLVSFAFEALQFLEQTKAMYDEIMVTEKLEQKGAAGLWVDKLVDDGLKCFPPTVTVIPKEN